jgi:hypothetical protein
MSHMTIARAVEAPSTSLKDRGIEQDRRKYGRGFKGIKLKDVSDAAT